MKQTSRNSRLKHHLVTLKAYAVAAKTIQDIDKAAQHIETYSRSAQYKFNHSLGFIGVALAVLLVSLSYWGQMDLSYDQRIGMRITSFVLALATIASIWKRYASIKSVGDQLYVRAVSINAGIERDYQFNGKAYWRELKATFPVFDCGDEGQTITKRYIGGVDATPFTLFEFKYVNVTTHYSTDSNGNSRTTKARNTQYKHGLLVQFEGFNYLTLNANRFSTKWDSASRTFNKLFKVRCASEILAAKFFDPKVVLAFVDKYNFIKSMDVSSQSVACFELPKSIFPTQVAKPSLRQPDDFVKQLKTPVKIPLLESSKELVQFINENK